MSKKNRKRREIARRQKEQRRANVAASSEDAEETEDAEDAEDAAPEDEASRIRRRAEQKHEYEKRKRAKARGGQSRAPYFWGGGVAVIALALLGGFLILGGSGGGDGGDATPAPSATPDPRIAGLPIDRTITMETDDDGQNVNTRFIPNAITGQAGEVIEILVTNVGSVAHNLTFPGLDGEYDTPDDWLIEPFSLQPGDTGRVVVKFDEPDSYPFRCALHPLIHFGTLTLS